MSINNPHIRDTITIDDTFNKMLSTFVDAGPLYVLARVIDQQTDLLVGSRSVIIVADEFRGNDHLIDARGTDSTATGGAGTNAQPTPVGNPGNPGSDGGAGGAGGAGGTVTLMCRTSSGVRISTSGGAGAAGGPGGKGGPGSPAKSIPGGTTTETVIDADGNAMEVEVPLPDIEIPGTLGGMGGSGGNGGAGGDAGAIRFTSISDNPPTLEATGGAGGSGGPGGLAGPNGAFAEVPDDFDPTPVPGQPGAAGADGAISVTTLSEDDYVAGLRPLLDAQGPSFANHWAPYRRVVGQYFYRQFRRSDPTKGRDAATEFARTLELQPDNVEALRWQRQLNDYPRPTSSSPDVTWEPGGLNALGLPRNLDVLPQFQAYRDAFTSFGTLVLNFLTIGSGTILQTQDLTPWRSFLDEQRQRAVAAHETTIEDRAQAETETRIAGEDLAGVQARLDETTREIQASLDAMREEPLSIAGIVGTVAGVAAAVVAVVAAVPSAGASLVALVPSMVALSSAVIDNAEPIAKAVLAGEKANTDAVKKAYEKVDKTAADVVKGAKAIVDFVKVVQQLTKSTTPDNSKHLALVRQGLELTHELLLARHRVELARQRRDAADARVARAVEAVTGIDALRDDLAPTVDALRSTALHAIEIAEARADALLTLAFYAQRSVEIYTLTDQEDKVRLESGHLHPDRRRDFDEGAIDEIQLVGLLNESWAGLLGLLDLQLEYDRFTTQFHDQDRRRLSFRAGSPEVDALRATRRFAFRIDASTLPANQADAKVRGVRLALVGATHPAGEVTCEIRHGSSYESRRSSGDVTVAILQPQVSNRTAKLSPLAADEGLGPDPLLTDPQSLAFWGRGIGGEYELSIPDHEFEAGLDLTGLTEVQVFVSYQFIR